MILVDVGTFDELIGSSETVHLLAGQGSININTDSDGFVSDGLDVRQESLQMIDVGAIR